MQSGDFILVKGTGFFDRLIQFGQGIRFGKQYAQWNHCALVISENGDIIEAVTKGVSLNNVSKYKEKNIEYILVDTISSIQDREEVVNFAKSCVGQQYGWFNFISTTLAAFTGMKFSFGLSSTEICSGLVAKSLERTTAIFDYDASNISPAYLANYYLSVNKPAKGVNV
jgi:hypothetical protein